MFLWSIGLYTANHTALHPDKLDSSVVTLRELHNLHHQCFFLGCEGFSIKWNFTVLLPYKRQSLMVVLCSANPEYHTHNYILFAVNVCNIVCCCIIGTMWNVHSFTQFDILFYTLTLCSRPSQNPPSTVTLKPFLLICIGMGVLETTLMLKRDSSCTNTTLDSMSANRLPETE